VTGPQRLWVLGSLLLALGCGDAPGEADASLAPDAGATPEDAARPRADAAARPDAGGECFAIEGLATFRLDVDDDTGLRARARITPDVEDAPWDLYLWFQRFAGASFTGTVPLGVEPNESFPDCPHCVVALQGADLSRGFLAAEGTLELNRSPFDGRLDLSLTGVVLREVVVEASDDPLPVLRSRWVEDGACLALPPQTVSVPLAPGDWRCDPELWADGEGCDCACGAWDPDCDACDPFLDPSCDPGVRRPTRRCGSDEVCLFEADEGICAATCDEGDGCSAGFCAYWPSGDRVCVNDPDRQSAADVGEACLDGGGLRYCAVRDGVAGGVCAEWSSGADPSEDAVFECWAACASDAECGDGLTCVALGGAAEADAPGYCQPPHPRDWSCAPDAWEDGACDCRCGVWDPDCGASTIHAPRPSARCAAGEVCVREDPFLFGSPGECVVPPPNDTCATAAPLPLDEEVSGATRGATPSYGADGCFEREVSGADVVYAVELAVGDRLEVSVRPDGHDPVLYLIGPGEAAVCDGAFACAASADAAGLGVEETLTHTATAAGTHYLVVDGDPFAFGFTLRATVAPTG
jgi:hypothetical protein